MYNIQNPSLEHDKINILEQNSDFINSNYRKVNIADLVRKYRKNSDDIAEYWAWLPPEFTSISHFIPLINLHLV